MEGSKGKILNKDFNVLKDASSLHTQCLPTAQKPNQTKGKNSGALSVLQPSPRSFCCFCCFCFCGSPICLSCKITRGCSKNKNKLLAHAKLTEL